MKQESRARDQLYFSYLLDTRVHILMSLEGQVNLEAYTWRCQPTQAGFSQRPKFSDAGEVSGQYKYPRCLVPPHPSSFNPHHVRSQAHFHRPPPISRRCFFCQPSGTSLPFHLLLPRVVLTSYKYQPNPFDYRRSEGEVLNARKDPDY